MISNFDYISITNLQIEDPCLCVFGKKPLDDIECACDDHYGKKNRYFYYCYHGDYGSDLFFIVRK